MKGLKFEDLKKHGSSLLWRMESIPEILGWLSFLIHLGVVRNVGLMPDYHQSSLEDLWIAFAFIILRRHGSSQGIRLRRNL